MAGEMRKDFDSGLSSYTRNPIGPVAMSEAWSMIRKSGYRFSEKIMLKQKDRVG